jgi:GR25 family glycosyltransferase involved in LPS biosynthesis
MQQDVPLWGCYINLDRSPERAAWMEAQLSRLGLDWVRRLPAVDGRQLTVPQGCPLLPGALACFHSHVLALEQAPPGAHVLVLEDDTELCDQFAEYLHQLVRAPIQAFDVVHLECQPNYSIAHLSELWRVASRRLAASTTAPLEQRGQGMELLEARAVYHWSNSAYLVTPAGRARILERRKAWLADGPKQPLDRSTEQAFATQALRGAVTVPFLATTGLRWHGDSTIGNGEARLPPEVLMLLRRLLYAGSAADVEPMAARLAAKPVDAELAMFALVLREIAGWEREAARAAAP